MKNPRIYCVHILEAIEHIEKFISETRDYQEFCNNFLVLSAVVRQLEIIGEASIQLPDDVKVSHPQIPWKEIKSMRNRLIHEYFSVDTQVVWETVTHDLPPLKIMITHLLESL